MHTTLQHVLAKADLSHINIYTPRRQACPSLTRRAYLLSSSTRLSLLSFDLMRWPMPGTRLPCFFKPSTNAAAPRPSSHAFLKQLHGRHKQQAQTEGI
jgi:hypothetical protein